MRTVGHLAQQLPAKTRTIGRQRQHLHPTVVRRRTALDQALVLEPIHEAGDVRRVAGQRLRQVAHRYRLFRFDEVQDMTLHRRQTELRPPGGQVPALDEKEPHQQLPRAARVVIGSPHRRPLYW